MDAFALHSHRRALAAEDAGITDRAIVAVDAPVGGGALRVSRDEGPAS